MPNQTGEGRLVLQIREWKSFNLTSMTGSIIGDSELGTIALREYYDAHAASGLIEAAIYEPTDGPSVPATLAKRHDKERNADDLIVTAGGQVVVRLLGPCSKCEPLGHCYACDEHGSAERDHWCPVDQTSK